MKYDVFISYSRKDTDIANRICAAFDKVGISYFIDRQGISGGFEFPAVLAEAIIKSQVVLFLASSSSYESKFTNAELTFSFNEKPKNSILPYIIDNSTMPPALRLVFSSINWRTLESHPIETTLMEDILKMLGREASKPSNIDSSASAQAPQTRATTAQISEWSQMGYEAYQKRDYTEAVKWFHKAAEYGSTNAQFNLGTCYYIGNGVSQNYTEAAKWYRKAAEQGQADAQYGLGVCYAYGNGVSQDYTEAANWYRKAAEQGHERAKNMLNSISGNNNAAKTYKVGDYYNESGKEGIVFDIWDGGKHGKIVSLDQASLLWCAQAQHLKKISVGATSQTDGKANTDKVMARTDSTEYPAFVWCRDKGKEWYLPSVEELNMLLKNEGIYDAVNRALESRSATKLLNREEWDAYWSSTERNAYCAVYAAIRSIGTQDPSKYSYKHVRAISTF